MKADMDTVPRCPKCNSIARPNILMFNDWHWILHYSEQTTKMHRVEKSTSDVVVIDLGSGTAVPTCRHTGEQVTQLYEQSSIIRINKREKSNSLKTQCRGEN